MSRIGIFGGMGPSATVDFMDKIIRLTPATRDQEHIPSIVANLPHIPDRSAAILGHGEDPLPALLYGIDLLNQVGVGVVAIPCNSSHHWYVEMAERSTAPIIHIAQACVDAIPDAPNARIAILATRGALASGFYQAALQARALEFVVPDASGAQHQVDACIKAIKGGDMSAGTEALNQVFAAMQAAGATAAILGCTELPVAARTAAPTSMALIDSSLELARATVTFALAKGWNQPTWPS